MPHMHRGTACVLQHAKVQGSATAVVRCVCSPHLQVGAAEVGIRNQRACKTATHKDMSKPYLAQGQAGGQEGAAGTPARKQAEAASMAGQQEQQQHCVLRHALEDAIRAHPTASCRGGWRPPACRTAGPAPVVVHMGGVSEQVGVRHTLRMTSQAAARNAESS